MPNRTSQNQFAPNFVSDTGFSADLKEYQRDTAADASSSRPVIHEEWPLELGVMRPLDRTAQGSQWRGFIKGMSERFGDLGEVVGVDALAVELVAPDEITGMLNDKHRSLGRDPRGEQTRRRVAKDLTDCLSETLRRYQRSQVQVEMNLLGEQNDGESRVFEQTARTDLWGSTGLEIKAVPQVIGSRTLALGFDSTKQQDVLVANRSGVLDALQELHLNVSDARKRTFDPVLAIYIARQSLVGQVMPLPSIPFEFQAGAPRTLTIGQ